nr:uncharacterized protein LOC109748012 [Aegilops tauschii subsp. strangulata]
MEGGGESADWKSDDESDEESADSSSSEEVDSPPCSEKRSKHSHDPAGGYGKVAPPSMQVLKQTRTSTPDPPEKAPKQPKVAPTKPRKALPKIKVDVPVASAAATSGTSMDIYKDQDEEETEDAATSRAAPPNVIELPDHDDHEDVPQRNTGRRGRTLGKKVPASKASHSTPASDSVVPQLGDPARASVSFVHPMSTAQPSVSTIQPPAPTAQPQTSVLGATSSVPPTPLFATHHVSENEVSATKEVVSQAGLMMERMKVVYETSKAAYDASSALQANVQALEQKDLDLAAAQKTARERTELADKKLASVEFCRNFKEETGRIETSLDPINSHVKDEATMNVMRLESRLASVLDYLARLKVAVSRVDTELWPVHCKEVKEEKLASLKVANTKKLQFQSFMGTFIDASTRIADGIDLDEFVEPASPPPAE